MVKNNINSLGSHEISVIIQTPYFSHDLVPLAPCSFILSTAQLAAMAPGEPPAAAGDLPALVHQWRLGLAQGAGGAGADLRRVRCGARRCGGPGVPSGHGGA